jgi:hypothetical protein
MHASPRWLHRDARQRPAYKVSVYVHIGIAPTAGVSSQPSALPEVTIRGTLPASAVAGAAAPT